jgi:hypothetical protein
MMRADADGGEFNMRFATAPRCTADLSGCVGECVAPADPSESRVGERDDRVEVAARDGAEHQDDREQASCGRGGVLEQLQTDVAGRERLGGDAGADYERGEEGRAQELGEQAAMERWCRTHTSATASQWSCCRHSRVWRTASATMWVRTGASSKRVSTAPGGLRARVVEEGLRRLRACSIVVAHEQHVSHVAYRHGYLATFMPQPIFGQASTAHFSSDRLGVIGDPFDVHLELPAGVQEQGEGRPLVTVLRLTDRSAVDEQDASILVDPRLMRVPEGEHPVALGGSEPLVQAGRLVLEQILVDFPR